MPPANVCENASTLRAWASVGSCGVNGQCSYTYSFISCAAGCSGGTCTASGWTKMVSNTTFDLDAVWAASGSSAWAGGAQGTLVYWNGTQWQVKSSGTAENIIAIHGASATSVFALGAQGSLLYWDGASWTKISGTTNVLATPLTLYADSATSVWEFGTKVSGSVADGLAHYTFSAGTWTGVAVTNSGATAAPFRRGTYGYRMWFESPTAIYLPGGNLFDGTSNALLGQSVYLGEGPGKIWKSGNLILALSWENGSTGLYQLVGNTWTPMSTGFAGTSNDFHGPSASRLFLVGKTYTSPNYTGHVLYYDGSGWTEQVLPAGTDSLTSVWALSSGEVFAVGRGGTIVKGP
jgi:hypothetical protein